jgi:hypothetical protein
VAVNGFGTKWPYEFMDDPFLGTKRPRTEILPTELCLGYSSSIGLTVTPAIVVTLSSVHPS